MGLRMNAEASNEKTAVFHRLTVLVFILLFGLAVLINSAVPSWAWVSIPIGIERSSLLMGVLISEVALLAIWAAVANQGWVVRTTLPFVAFWALVFVLVEAVELERGFKLSREIVYRGVVAMSILGLATSFALRWLNGSRHALTRLSRVRCVSGIKKQFSILQILVFTAMTAIVVQRSVYLLGQSDVSGEGVMRDLVFFPLLIFHSCCVTLPCFWLVFSGRHRKTFGIWFLLVILGLVSLTSAGVVFLIGIPAKYFGGICFNIFLYTASLVLTNLSVLTIFYLMGYRNRPTNLTDLAASS